jgi:hypothetical protein
MCVYVDCRWLSLSCRDYHYVCTVVVVGVVYTVTLCHYRVCRVFKVSDTANLSCIKSVDVRHCVVNVTVTVSYVSVIVSYVSVTVFVAL